jgi:hypothetical protein
MKMLMSNCKKEEQIDTHLVTDEENALEYGG